MPAKKPIIDWSDQELRTEVRRMYDSGIYTVSPNDIYL